MTDQEVIVELYPTEVSVETGTQEVVIESPGPQGPPGPAGAAGGDPLEVELNNEGSKVIDHDLGRYPMVQVITEDGDLVDASVIHNTVNQLVVSFSIPLTGTVVLI